MINEYNPNIRWGKQRVEVTLMQWGYSKKFTVDIGGNCTGFDVLESAAGRIYDALPKKDYGEDEVAFVVLDRPDGDTLECTDDESRDEDWLKDMIVSLQIVGYTPPTLNEVREMNGVAPLPDGDRPWQP